MTPIAERDGPLRDGLQNFFAYARERYQIQLRRAAGSSWHAVNKFHDVVAPFIHATGEKS